MKTTNPMMRVKMSNKSKPNNGVNMDRASRENLPSCRCQLRSRIGAVFIELLLIRGQREKSEENRVAIQYYYRSKYEINRYRRRMYTIWNEIGMFNVTEQR